MSKKQTVFNTINDIISTGRFCKARFIKKDGTPRTMHFRTGVRCHTKGGELAYDPKDYGLILVWDIEAKGYRMINTATVLWVKADGREVHFG